MTRIINRCQVSRRDKVSRSVNRLPEVLRDV